MTPKVTISPSSTSPSLMGDSAGSLESDYPDSTYGTKLEIDLTPALASGYGLEGASRVLRTLPMASSTRFQLAKLLSTLQLAIVQILEMSTEEIYLPRLQAHISEDGSILLEWISSKYRIGFNIETDPSESSWFLVTTDELGGIQASGRLDDAEIPRIISWFSTFLITHF